MQGKRSGHGVTIPSDPQAKGRVCPLLQWDCKKKEDTSSHFTDAFCKNKMDNLLHGQLMTKSKIHVGNGKNWKMFLHLSGNGKTCSVYASVRCGVPAAELIERAQALLWVTWLICISHVPWQLSFQCRRPGVVSVPLEQLWTSVIMQPDIVLRRCDLLNPATLLPDPDK